MLLAAIRGGAAGQSGDRGSRQQDFGDGAVSRVFFMWCFGLGLGFGWRRAGLRFKLAGLDSLSVGDENRGTPRILNWGCGRETVVIQRLRRRRELVSLQMQFRIRLPSGTAAKRRPHANGRGQLFNKCYFHLF